MFKARNTTKNDQCIRGYTKKLRLEIEEFFKDAKWLLGLEWVRFLKATSMANLLWFIILGLWFIETLRTIVEEPTWKNHHAISFNRLIWERLQREKNHLVLQYCRAEEVVAYG